MPDMCDKDPNCLNSKILILDTNFLDQINRTVRVELSATSGQSVEHQRPGFLTRVQNIVENIAHCGRGHVFTSETVYGDEIDISKLDSALRTADPEFFGNLCMDVEFTNNLSDVYLDGINIEELPEGQVLALQEILSKDVGLADVGLVLLALNLSQDQEVILITDDLMLKDTIKDLIRKGNIKCEDDILTTKNLHCMGSLIFLKSLHTCCKMSNERWRAAIWSFTVHQAIRYEKREISEKTYDKHCQYSELCFAQLRADCVQKIQKEERAESFRLFGVIDDR